MGYGRRRLPPGSPRKDTTPFAEVELKLAVAPEHLTAVLDHAAITGRAAGKPVTATETTFYYDTVEAGFAARGMALRVRKVGRRREQTLKGKIAGDAPGPAGVAVKHEWTWPVRSDEPDLSLLPPGVAPLSALAGITCLFKTVVERTHRTLVMSDGTRIALAVDRGVIVAGDKEQPISEIEFELIDGDPAKLFQLAEALGRDMPLRINPSSKADLGYRLALDRAPVAVKAKRLPFDPDISTGAAFVQVVESCLEHLLANEPAARTPGGMAGVHQMRVALRRLRSGLGLFSRLIGGVEARHLRDEAKWLANALSTLREWDVFIDETAPGLIADHAAAEAVTPMMTLAEKRRQRARLAAEAAIASERAGRFALQTAAWVAGGRWRQGVAAERLPLLADPLREVARDWLDRRWKAAVKAAAGLETMPAEARHEVRLLVKKLRYSVDFVESLYPGRKTDRFMARLADVQTVLGRLNDLAVAEGQVASLRQDAGAYPDHDTEDALDLMTGRVISATDEPLGRLGREWARLEAVGPFWRGK